MAPEKLDSLLKELLGKLEVSEFSKRLILSLGAGDNQIKEAFQLLLSLRISRKKIASNVGLFGVDPWIINERLDN